MTGKSFLVRFFLTVVLIGGLSFSNTLLNRGSRVVSGEVAVHQFDNSDMSYVASQSVIAHMTDWHIPGLVIIVLVGAFWYKPVSNLCKQFVEDEKEV